MMTMLSAMRVLCAKAAIIGIALAALAALAGCSAVRLTYNNGPQLAWWWLDGYLDFSTEQTPAAKQAIDGFFDWHRASQLPDYAALLAQARTQVLEPTTPAAACRWQTQVRLRLDPAIDRALSHLADLLPGLGEAQFKHLERRYAKTIDEMRDDYLQPDPAQRLKAAIKRAVDRTEQVYGSIDEPQRRVIAAGVAASPFDAPGWLAERQRRHKDTVATLRRLAADRADRDQRMGALRALADRLERSPDAAYRAYQQRLADYNCAFAAQVHNATTPAQRLKARETLKGWEDDLRALIANPPTAAPAAVGG